MSHPRTGAHRPNQHERQQRRAAIEHLLARALRGALTVPEAAVLADYWRAEQRAADATRKSLTDTTSALTKHREAADAAIRELEQRAERAEAERDRYRAAWQSARQRARGYAQQLNPDAPIPYQVAGPDAPEVITDRAAIRAALDDPEPRPAPQHIGQGANAEDCPACRAAPEPPPYPFLCPGPDAPKE